MRRRRTTVITMTLLIGLVAVPVMLTWRQVRQAQINRQLLMAVNALDVSQVRDCLHAGADPNLSVGLPVPPALANLPGFRHWKSASGIVLLPDPLSPRQALSNLLGHRHSQSKAWRNRSLLLAVICHALSDGGNKGKHAAIALLLVQFGADPERSDDTVIYHGHGYYSPLYYAVEMGSVEVVKALLDHGAQASPDGRLPLCLAAATDNTPVALLLLTYGANPNCKPSPPPGFLNTPLIEATSRGDEVLVRALLKHKADPSLRNWFGQTPLDCARKFKACNIVRLLKQAGAKQ